MTDAPSGANPPSGNGPWDWDRTVNEILGGGQSGPISRLDVTGIPWLEHVGTRRDEAYKNGIYHDLEPWKYSKPNTMFFYRWVKNRGLNDVDNIIVEVSVKRDQYLPAWEEWSRGSYLAVQPFADSQNHRVLDRQSFVNAAQNFYLVEQWLVSTSAMIKQQMDSINTEASGFSGSAAEAFRRNLENLYRDLDDLHGDLTNKRIASPAAWSTMLLNGADAIGEFGKAIRDRAWHNKPNWTGPDGIIYGSYLIQPAGVPSLTERTSERSVYQAVLNSLSQSWETKSQDGHAYGMPNWNVTVDLSLAQGDSTGLTATVDILHGESWRTIDNLAKLRWVKGIEHDLDTITKQIVPTLATGLQGIRLRTPTGVKDLEGGANDQTDGGGGGGGGGGGNLPPPPDFSKLFDNLPNGGGGGGLGDLNGGGGGGGGLDRDLLNNLRTGGGIGDLTGGGGGGAGLGGTGGLGSLGGLGGIGGLSGLGGLGRTGADTGTRGRGSVALPPGSGLIGGGSGSLGPTLGRPVSPALPGASGGGGGLGPSAVDGETIGQLQGVSATPFGGGFGGGALDGQSSYGDLAQLSADAAAQDLDANGGKPGPGAGTGAGMATGMGGYPFMPPMGGMGAGQGNKQENRERKTWLTEDEDAWGADPGALLAVVGRDRMPDPDTDPAAGRTEAPGTTQGPARGGTTGTTRRGRA